MNDKPVDPIFDVLIPNMLNEAFAEGKNSSSNETSWEPFQPWTCKCGQFYIVASEEKLDDVSWGNPEKLAADLKAEIYIYTQEPLHCRRCGALLKVLHESDLFAAEARHAANLKIDMALPTLDELKLIAQEPEVCEIMKLNFKKVEFCQFDGEREIHVKVVSQNNVTTFIKLKTTRYQAYKTYFEQAGMQVDESFGSIMSSPKIT